MENPATSKPSWQDPIRQHLERQLSLKHCPHIAILGIGNDLRGDDGVGPTVARALKKLLDGRANLLILDAGPVPENFTGAIRQFGPDLILLIDAAALNESPGSVFWIDWRETSGFSASSHTLPPRILIEYLTAELGCEVFVIGIQPGDTSLGASLSKPVQTSKHFLIKTLTEALK